MQVKVFATLRPIVGGAIVPVTTEPGQTVRVLVDEMITRWPDLRPDGGTAGNLLQRIQIFVNGRNIIYLNGIETIIPEKANISIFRPWEAAEQC